MHGRQELNIERSQNLKKTLTMFRLSEHSLNIERLCFHCDEGAIETELHFISQCQKYRGIREELFFFNSKKESQNSKVRRKWRNDPAL